MNISFEEIVEFSILHKEIEHWINEHKTHSPKMIASIFLTQTAKLAVEYSPDVQEAERWVLHNAKTALEDYKKTKS